jgi:ABC-type tungstate transport system permease subunit
MSHQKAASPGLALASTIGPIDAGIVPALIDAYRDRTGVEIALPVNPAKVGGVRGEAAAAFVAWLLGDEAQRLIAGFGVERYGQPHFFPRAPRWSRLPTALMRRQPHDR